MRKSTKMAARWTVSCRSRRKLVLLLTSLAVVVGYYVFSGSTVTGLMKTNLNYRLIPSNEDTALAFLKKITTPSFKCPMESVIKIDAITRWSLCLQQTGRLYDESQRSGVCKMNVVSDGRHTDKILITSLEQEFPTCQVLKTANLDKSNKLGQNGGIGPSGNLSESQLMKLDVRMNAADNLMELAIGGAFRHVSQLLLEVNLTCGDVLMTRRKITKWEMVLQQLEEIGFSLAYVHTTSESKMVDIGLQKNYPCCYSTTWVKTFKSTVSLQPWAGSGVADETWRFLRQITTVSSPPMCNSLKRVGNAQDGGWTLCFDKTWGLWDKPCTVYSFGIAKDWTFDKSLADYGCDVYAFDPSIGIERRTIQEGMWFYNIGLLDRNSDEYYGMGMGNQRGKKWKVRTLEGLRRDLGHSARQIAVMKMDIEGSEWVSLRQMLENGTLRFIKQLVFEIHLWHQRNTDHRAELRLRYSILLTLENQGFRLVHWHKNPMSTAVNLGRGYEKEACCYELTYVNTRYGDWWS